MTQQEADALIARLTGALAPRMDDAVTRIALAMAAHFERAASEQVAERIRQGLAAEIAAEISKSLATNVVPALIAPLADRVAALERNYAALHAAVQHALEVFGAVGVDAAETTATH
jgi:hypothetical protein